MKKTLFAILTVALLISSCSSASKVIKTKIPPRPAGAESMLGFAAEPIDTVHIGIIGLGMRGSSAIPRFMYLPGTKVVAVCDIVPERTEAVQNYIESMGRPRPEGFSGEDGWKSLCELENVDLVYICTDWLSHVPLALYAMECGHHVAVEVPAAPTLKDCWDLINMSEKTRKHCMMLENCVYDFFELAGLQLAREGLLGDIIHAEGAYCHNLDPFWDYYWNNWRLDYNQKHRGDVYATHGMGPVCQALNIHRGDRMKTLVAMDTDPFNGPKLVEKRTGKPCTDFANGDQTSTMIRTEKGKTILIEHDVMTPRPYTRMYQLVGTSGYVGKYPVEQVCLGQAAGGEINFENLDGEIVYQGASLDALLDGHRPEILTPELEELAKIVGGHGGMDFIMDYRLIYCLHKGLPLDMDVYDLAEWCCIGELSRISIENGCAPVEVPDFTRGSWDVVKGFSYAF
ncbi:MAG: Gfo/Idh/MocA family oxidoreductase [Bacteroidales bacterium]|nr:Gfo/Idh/MocA family oxidoreductase [Bacteroidales bacterium]